MSILLLITSTALLVFSYHYERNGNPWNLGEMASRLMWGCALGIAYAACAFPFASWEMLAFIPLGYASLMVPHAWVQNMGTWATPQKKWPGFFLPTYTADQWTALSPLRRMLYDLKGMASVGFLRGVIVFAPLIFMGMHALPAIVAALIQMITQPLSYLLGRFTPFALFGNAPKSAQWGEFFIGIGWAVSLYAAASLA